MARGRPPKVEQPTETYLDRVGREVSSSQSKVSMVLGALIILVVGVLIFNYFNRTKTELGPAQQTETEGDKYVVKEGDTLFLIAEKYYQDGYKYPEIAKENNITNVDAIEVGLLLQIPKLEAAVVALTPAPTQEPLGTGGADTTIWGPKIEGDTYTVVEGDWLSTISAKAYGDIFAYPKLAEANNIQNPDLIFPGQVLKIPR